MQAIFDVVLPVFAIILSGYLAGHFKILGPDSAEALNRFVFYFALPPLLFLSTARVDVAEILRWPFLTAYVAGSLGTGAIAIAGARYLFGLRDPAAVVLHGLTAVFANTGYLGIPLFLAAFGEARLLPAVVATVATNVLLIGIAIAVVEGVRDTGRSRLAAGLRGLGAAAMSPIFLAPAAGITVSMIGFDLPGPVARFAELLGATAGPGALFALGLSLVGRSLAEQMGELSWLVALKLLVHPLLTWVLVTYVVEVEPFWAQSAVLLAAMPSGALVYVLAQQYGIYVQRSSAAILVTTILSVLTLSFLLVRM